MPVKKSALKNMACGLWVSITKEYIFLLLCHVTIASEPVEQPQIFIFYLFKFSAVEDIFRKPNETFLYVDYHSDCWPIWGK